MEFREAKPIYVQIADRVCEAVLSGTWEQEERIPSIREMAIETEVNPNTVTRTYALLQEQGIVYNRRGIGYFVSDGAVERIQDLMKQEFMERELPDFFRRLDVLGISIEEITESYRHRKVETGVQVEGKDEDQ